MIKRKSPGESAARGPKKKGERKDGETHTLHDDHTKSQETLSQEERGHEAKGACEAPRIVPRNTGNRVTRNPLVWGTAGFLLRSGFLTGDQKKTN